MDSLPPAENQIPPADSMTAAPQPLPTPSVPPTKRTYSNVVQNNKVASLHFDPNRAAKKTIWEKESAAMGTVSSFKRDPGISFSYSEIATLAERLKYALVGKFSHGLPNLTFLKNRIVKLDLRGFVCMGAINVKHVLIHLSHEEDYSRLWLRG
ncbi:hypothetical protein Salat_1172600 [Sesamum alatum]|uniref:Uncharacterized protein n=1 Tax=Sesamum alatum TaxID=300844 RepID=A0AAE1YES3_9LAMI|nr:hypothetical protein Salat_1172600 [Sesamum alatum]